MNASSIINRKFLLLIECSENLKKSRTLPLMMIALPIAVYFVYIVVYGVNIVLGDEIELVPLIKQYFLGKFPVALVWAQHNENRMVVPNLFFLSLAKTTHLNMKIAMYVSGCLIVLSYIFFVLIYSRRFSKNHWEVVLPAYLMFNLIQYENTLWGFQVAWYMILACLFGMLFFLDQTGRSNEFFLSAALLAFVASFSSFQGLFLWPAGLVYIFLSDFKQGQKMLWIIFMVISIIGYFFQFNFHKTGGPPVLEFLSHPMVSIEYFFVSMGATLHFGGIVFDVYAGLFLFSLMVSVVLYIIRTNGVDRALLFPLSLLMYVILFDISLTVGRSGFGLAQASSSRYMTYDLLFLISIYLLFVKLAKGALQRKKIVHSALGILIGFLIVQVAVSYQDGIAAGQEEYRSKIVASDVFMHYKKRSDKLIEQYIYPDAQILRRRATVLQQYHLSIFHYVFAHQQF